MSVFSSIGVQFLCAAGKSHLWKDQGVASDIGHCSDCVVHGCAKKIACCWENTRRAVGEAVPKHFAYESHCIKVLYMHICMSFANFIHIACLLHISAKPMRICISLRINLLKVVTCSNFVCLRHVRINFCVVTCSSLLCVCVCVCLKHACMYFCSFLTSSELRVATDSAMLCRSRTT